MADEVAAKISEVAAFKPRCARCWSQSGQCRSNALPDIPVISDTVPGYEAVNWTAVLGPKALPKEIVARWNREIDRILRLPDVHDRIAGLGMEFAGGSPEPFRVALQRDVAKWQKVVKIANIKPGS